MIDPDLDADIEPGEQPGERDIATVDMFGGPAPPPVAAAAPVALGGAYQVLARKYRPRTFEDLIGQEAMVRTLANAFASGRIAHGFMLTGVRGVGKTTTARLLARALNYESAEIHRPTVDLSVDGRHCRSIIEGRHMDVLELDAASRTKVEDMRDLLEGVRYAPVEARYKVYVIDEVHMLSTQSFNALLKTLEEPPPHAKFIFATTEIRKVPVTILSRCQRFDLRRVEPNVLATHLRSIAVKEVAQIDEEGIALIARAAEGSVRDGLSLLDQAIVQAEGGQLVQAKVVRDMLGLADRGQTIALFETVMGGRPSEALKGFRSLYGFGADPAQVVGDLLDHAHGASVAKTLGPDVLSLPSDQAARLAAVGSQTSAGALSRIWQMLLKAHEEVRRAPDPAAAVDMALIRLCYAANLPGPEEALRALQAGEPSMLRPPASPTQVSGQPGQSVSGRVKLQPRAQLAPDSQLASQPQLVPQAESIEGSAQPAESGVRPIAKAAEAVVLATFADVVKLIETRRDVTLKLDVERYVRLIDFKPGVIAFEPAPGAPANLPQRLSGRLKEWTGQPWMMDLKVGAPETSYERERREDGEARTRVEADPFVKSIMAAFPGAEIVGVRKLADPAVDARSRDLPETDETAGGVAEDD